MDNNERIIEEVRKYDCLNNLQSGSYKNFQYKEDLWCKIAEEGKKKFSNLRDTYKEWKQKDNLLSGSAALITNHIAMRQNKFLRKCYKMYAQIKLNSLLGDICWNLQKEEE